MFSGTKPGKIGGFRSIKLGNLMAEEFSEETGSSIGVDWELLRFRGGSKLK